jgi:hypothetical protein
MDRKTTSGHPVVVTEHTQYTQQPIQSYGPFNQPSFVHLSAEQPLFLTNRIQIDQLDGPPLNQYPRRAAPKKKSTPRFLFLSPANPARNCRTTN